jgi:hypothetical protein
MWHAWGERCLQGLGWYSCREETIGCRCEGNIKMYLRETWIHEANWIRLARDRVQWRAFVNTVMNLRAPYLSRILFDKLSDYQLFK